MIQTTRASPGLLHSWRERVDLKFLLFLVSYSRSYKRELYFQNNVLVGNFDNQYTYDKIPNHNSSSDTKKRQTKSTIKSSNRRAELTIYRQRGAHQPRARCENTMQVSAAGHLQQESTIIDKISWSIEEQVLAYTQTKQKSNNYCQFSNSFPLLPPCNVGVSSANKTKRLVSLVGPACVVGNIVSGGK